MESWEARGILLRWADRWPKAGLMDEYRLPTEAGRAAIRALRFYDYDQAKEMLAELVIAQQSSQYPPKIGDLIHRLKARRDARAWQEAVQFQRAAAEVIAESPPLGAMPQKPPKEPTLEERVWHWEGYQTMGQRLRTRERLKRALAERPGELKAKVEEIERSAGERPKQLNIWFNEIGVPVEIQKGGE